MLWKGQSTIIMVIVKKHPNINAKQSNKKQNSIAVKIKRKRKKVNEYLRNIYNTFIEFIHLFQAFEK